MYTIWHAHNKQIGGNWYLCVDVRQACKMYTKIIRCKMQSKKKIISRIRWVKCSEVKWSEVEWYICWYVLIDGGHPLHLSPEYEWRDGANWFWQKFKNVHNIPLWDVWFEITVSSIIKLASIKIMIDPKKKIRLILTFTHSQNHHHFMITQSLLVLARYSENKKNPMCVTW